MEIELSTQAELNRLVHGLTQGNGLRAVVNALVYVCCIESQLYGDGGRDPECERWAANEQVVADAQQRLDHAVRSYWTEGAAAGPGQSTGGDGAIPPPEGG